MPSSSIIAHRMRSSSISEAAPSVSSFIDGLSPHPSVHTPSFLSSTPPPLISGLERHPDAPKPFSSSTFLDPVVESEDCDQGWWPGVESRLDTDYSWSSRYSHGSSQFMARSAVSNSAREYDQSYDDASPNPSTLSTSTDSTDSNRLHYELEDLRCTSPFDDPVEFTENGSEDAEEGSLITLATSTSEEPKSQSCSTFVNPFSDFSSYFESGLSKLMPRSPVPNALSRVLMEYFREMA